jgi:hypothetical protein
MPVNSTTQDGNNHASTVMISQPQQSPNHNLATIQLRDLVSHHSSISTSSTNALTPISSPENKRIRHKNHDSSSFTNDAQETSAQYKDSTPGDSDT